MRKTKTSIEQALRDAIHRLEEWIGADCECDNTHEQHKTKCCLCQYRDVLKDESDV